MKTFLRKKIHLVVVGWVPTIMFLAAVSKVASWSAFESSMQTFTLVGDSVQSAAIMLVPAGETAAIVLLLSGWRIAANLWSLVLLLLFTGMFLWHGANNIVPDCACLGLWSQYLETEDAVKSALTRNSVLILGCIVGSITSFAGIKRERRVVPTCEGGVKCDSADSL